MDISASTSPFLTIGGTLSGTYAFTTGSPGRFTFTVASPAAASFVVYQAAPGAFAVEVTSGNVASHAIFFQQ